MLVMNGRSDIHKALLRWAKKTRDAKMFNYGEGVKAAFVLNNLVTRFMKDNSYEMQKAGMIKLAYNPQRLIRSCFEKMIRACGLNLTSAWLSWRMWHLSKDRDAAMRARKKVASSNLGNILEKKRKSHLRSGVRPLARGVAHTKTQERVFNKMYYVAYGRLKNAFRDWTECLDHIRDALKLSVKKYAEGSPVALQLSSSYPGMRGAALLRKNSIRKTK